MHILQKQSIKFSFIEKKDYPPDTHESGLMKDLCTCAYI